MDRQITFLELQKKFTLDILKHYVELAEGFEIETFTKDFFQVSLSGEQVSIHNTTVFSTFLHRAVEGVNKSNLPYNTYIKPGLVKLVYAFSDKSYLSENYQPCHLTACEMAILDCLCEVLR